MSRVSAKMLGLHLRVRHGNLGHWGGRGVHVGKGRASGSLTGRMWEGA